MHIVYFHHSSSVCFYNLCENVLILLLLFAVCCLCPYDYRFYCLFFIEHLLLIEHSNFTMSHIISIHNSCYSLSYLVLFSAFCFVSRSVLLCNRTLVTCCFPVAHAVSTVLAYCLRSWPSHASRICVCGFARGIAMGAIIVPLEYYWTCVVPLAYYCMMFSATNVLLKMRSASGVLLHDA